MPEAKPSFAKIAFALVYILVFPAILLLLAGDWRWTEGWVFCGWFVALCFTTIFHLYRHDPALLAERYKKPGAANQKGWDKYVVYAIQVEFLAWIVLTPLDASRYAWSPSFPVWLEALGAVALLGSSFLFFRAYTDNTFLSPLVRIQSDRKHHVVSTGVYGFVRHPMYLGATLMFLGAPTLMGSLVGLAVGAALTGLLAGRILGEERMLCAELDGYAEYQQRVRYRLIPYVW